MMCHTTNTSRDRTGRASTAVNKEIHHAVHRATGDRVADRGRGRSRQRGYFTHATQNCASAGTIAVTVIAGPLNYFGANPKVTNCHVPQPS